MQRAPRVAILGIGHELRGDDAAGLSVARKLLERSSGRSNLLVIEAESAPENHTGPLRRFEPDLVLLVDAAEMGEASGVIRWLDWQETTGLSASTHTLPPYVLAQYLTSELHCDVALIGIQPAGTTIGAPLSPEVGQAVEAVVQALCALW